MEKVEWRHIKAAIFNINNNLCAASFFLINIIVQGLPIFLPTILADLGWTATKAQLYSVPPYVAACLVAILIVHISDKTRRRGIFLAGATILPIAGFSILRWSTNSSIRYMAVYFITVGAFPGGPGFLSWGINSEFADFLTLDKSLTAGRLCGTSSPSGCHCVDRVNWNLRRRSCHVRLVWKTYTYSADPV